MNADALARMTEATISLRNGDVQGATKIIQTALGVRPGQIPPTKHETGVGKLNPREEFSHARSVEIGARPRRRLADVVQLLRGLRSESKNGGGLPGNEALKRPILDPLPPGASFTEHAYSCDAGTRRYKLYKPNADSLTAQGLIVMLHGCTQNAADFAVGTRMNSFAHDSGFLVAYPEQTSKANQLKCWNWFNPLDQNRNDGEPSIVAGLTRELVAKHAVDQSRVYVAGLSSGGAMAAILGAAYPDIYSGVGIHSGLPAGLAYDVPSAFEAMRTGNCGRSRTSASKPIQTPAIIFHGDSDATVHPVNSVSLFQGVCEVGALSLTERKVGTMNDRNYKVQTASADGKIMAELWAIEGGGHAWSGGDIRGSYADPTGPCAAKEMLRFFLSIDGGKN